MRWPTIENSDLLLPVPGYPAHFIAMPLWFAGIVLLFALLLIVAVVLSAVSRKRDEKNYS